MLTIVMVLLLQIFNGMDWNCMFVFHSGACDAKCRMEHRTEAICQTDRDDLLMCLCSELLPFDSDFDFISSQSGKKILSFDFLHARFRCSGQNRRPPPEELVPLRC